MLGKVDWDASTGWPVISGVNGLPITGFKDDFKTNILNQEWQWDLRHSQPDIQIKNRTLFLTGAVTKDNITGTALTVRPKSGNYNIITSVINKNAALKGLTIYGDANQAVGIGVKKDSIIVWQVKDNTRRVLTAAVAPTAKLLYLKIKVDDGYQLHFYYGSDDQHWKEITADSNGEFLPPWDRSPRPGLIQNGSLSEPAAFGFFEISYN